ncbi:LysM domain protein [Talaromyces islandicus]|uniref:LysM domain protein n=1 Tax=Talaromyces islandicus TaxID=28573 RepID=A0A0U1M1T7_TALIS|nr:LysM domain protein [Talaromyces islandicus]
MFFSKILAQTLLLGGVTTALFVPIWTKESTSLEQEGALAEKTNMADENIWSTPTATIPDIKISRSNIADTPSPTQPGLISTCDAYYFVESGVSCSGIVSEFGNFTLSQFYDWNPAVKSDCSNLLAGYYVCIGVFAGTSTATSTINTPVPTTTKTPAPAPSPTQTGIASNCNHYYKVVSGDTCVSVSESNNITLAHFYDWNPAVGSSCQTLLAGYYVCVGVSGEQKTSMERRNAGALLKRVDSPTTAATITASATASATAIAVPSPTQTGIVSACSQYYRAQKGDTCVTIVNDHYPSLTVSQFESWNPAVGPSCDSLLAGYYYCVAT